MELSVLANKELVKNKYVAYRYMKDEIAQYRKKITFYRNGKALFEQFCYGESAGIIFSLWIDSISEDGTLNYKSVEAYIERYNYPKKIRVIEDENVMYFDDDKIPYKIEKQLKSDRPHGYSGGIIGRLLGK